MTISETIRSNGKTTLSEAEYQAARIRGHAAQFAGEKVNEFAENAKEQATDFTSSVQRAVQASATSLRKDGYGAIADVVETVTGGVRKVDDAISETNPARAGHTAQSLVRDKPLLVFGGLALAGFTIASILQAAGRPERREPESKKSNTRKRTRKSAGVKND